MSTQGRLEEARDIIFRTLCVKRGEVITKELAWDRANNAAQALMLLLDDVGDTAIGTVRAPHGNPGDVEDEPARRNDR